MGDLEMRSAGSGTVREVLTIEAGRVLPMTGTTDSPATTHGLKTSNISSSVEWASEPCECLQDG
jgi:hypothetical protein